MNIIKMALIMVLVSSSVYASSYDDPDMIDYMDRVDDAKWGCFYNNSNRKCHLLGNLLARGVVSPSTKIKFNLKAYSPYEAMARAYIRACNNGYCKSCDALYSMALERGEQNLIDTYRFKAKTCSSYQYQKK